MHSQGDRCGDAQRAIDAPARTMVIEDDDARLVQEQTADEIGAHVPERRQFIDGEVALERRIDRRHGPRVAISDGKMRDRAEVWISGANSRDGGHRGSDVTLQA